VSTEAKAPREPEASTPWLNVTAAAKYLGLDPATVYRLCTARRIRHRRVGVGSGRIVFSQADLDSYLEACVVEVGEPLEPDGLPALKHLSWDPPRKRQARKPKPPAPAEPSPAPL
jgi:excisionase family DNA binding protein